MVVVCGPMICCFCAHASIERRNKRQYFLDKASEPTLTYRIWKERKEQVAEAERARKELEDADREFQAYRAREERVGKRKRTSIFGRGSLPRHTDVQNRTLTAGNAGSVEMGSVASGPGGDGDEERVGEERAARPSAFTPESLARQAEMQNLTTGNGRPAAIESMNGGWRGDVDEERLVGDPPQKVLPKKRTSLFGEFFTKSSVPQEAEAQKGKTHMGSLIPESATRTRGGEADEEALVEGEPGVDVQMRASLKRPMWGSEAPPAYSPLSPEDHGLEGDLYSNTGR
jgi:hypothetical protein